MAEFSYESDIAPLRGDNFLTGPVPTGMEYQKFLTTKNFIERGLLAEKAGLEAERSKLAFESQKLQIEESTRKLREERDALTVLPDITKRLTDIRNNPELDDTQKIIKSAELESEYITATTRSPEVKNLFGTFNNSIKAKKEDLDRSNNLAYTLIQSGQGDAAKKILEGRTDPMAANFMVAADAVSAAKKQESESKSALKEQEFARGMDKETRAAQTEMLKDYMKTIRRLEPPKPSADTLEIGTLGGTPKTPAIPSATPPKYAKEDRAELEEIVRSLNENVDEKRLLSAPDIDLYKAALESTTGTLKNLAGFKSQFQRDKFRTTFPPQ